LLPARQTPGALNYSSAGAGSASHFAGEQLRVSAGIEAQHVPFKGAAEAVTEIVAGRIDFSPQLPTTTLPLINDGKLIALAVSAQKRIASLPEVPTTIEAGLKSDSVYPFYSGMFLPAKTPRNIVERHARGSDKALRTPDVKARFAKLGVEPMPMNLEEFATFFKQDVAAALALVKAANISSGNSTPDLHRSRQETAPPFAATLGSLIRCLLPGNSYPSYGSQRLCCGHSPPQVSTQWQTRVVMQYCAYQSTEATAGARSRQSLNAKPATR
jgi:hypothetical protein